MNVVDANSPVNAAAVAAPVARTEAENAGDRFLKLLVAQMQHQDPLNPLDNAEVTTQMAQISTVTGIEKMNRSIGAMTESFAAMQAMQAVNLVGHGVTLEGSGLRVDGNGLAKGGFALEAAADTVRIDILSHAGATIDTIELGATAPGRHDFEWAITPGVDPSQVAGFKVAAVAGRASVAAQSFMVDKVLAVRTDGSQLTLELQAAGAVPYAQIKSFH